MNIPHISHLTPRYLDAHELFDSARPPEGSTRSKCVTAAWDSAVQAGSLPVAM